MAPTYRYELPPPKGWARVLKSHLFPILAAFCIGFLVFAALAGDGSGFLMPGFLLLISMTAAVWYVGDALYDSQTILCSSGRRYPKYRILDYLTLNERVAVMNFEWANAQDECATPLVRGRKKEDLTTPRIGARDWDYIWCPLGAALSARSEASPTSPGPMYVTDKLNAPLRDVDQFMVACDSGHIYPTDIVDIFTSVDVFASS